MPSPASPAPPPAERCSSPVGAELLLQSQQRAAAALPGRLTDAQQQQQHHSRSASPGIEAPLKVSIPRAFSPVSGQRAATCCTPPAPRASSPVVGTDNLRHRSSLQGPRYNCCSRSADSSPWPGANSIAAAWLSQPCCRPAARQQQPVAAPTDGCSRPGTAAPEQQDAATTTTPSERTSPEPSLLAEASRTRPGVQVFSRSKAVLLEAELAALPAGQLFAAQQAHVRGWLSQQPWHKQPLHPALGEKQQQQQEQQQQPVQQPVQHPMQQEGLSCDVLSHQLAPWQQQTSKLMAQLTQQVAHLCVEHARTLEALQGRHAELVNALYLAVQATSQQYAAAHAAAEAASAALAAAHSSQAQLQQQLAVERAAHLDAQQQLSCLAAQHEQLQQEAQQTEQQLHQLMASLKQQLWQARADLEQQVAAADAAAAAEAAASSRRQADADAEVISLQQRLQFVHQQLRVLREQQQQVPAVTSAAVQTDAMQQPSSSTDTAPVQQQSASPTSEESSSSEDSSDDSADAVSVFHMLECVTRGHKRSRLWLVKVLGQLTADKAVADAVADRQGSARSSMREFVPAWSLNRYGLQHLSSQVLADLCSSICHHAATGLLPARWFACFCGLGPAVKRKRQQQRTGPWQLPGYSSVFSGGGATTTTSDALLSLPGPHEAELLLGSPAAADFWVFCACQLAYPNSVVALFPEAQEALPLVRSSLVMESLKAAFRYLGDAAGQAQFTADRLALAAVQPAAAEAGSVAAPGERPPSVLGRFGFYNAWVLLDLLLAEWLARAWSRAQHMEALRRDASSLQQRYLAATAAAAAAGTPGQEGALQQLQEAYTAVLQLLGLPLDGVQGAADSAAAEAVPCGDNGSSSSSTPLELLVQDAVSTDVDAAAEAYQRLLSLMDGVHPVE